MLPDCVAALSIWQSIQLGLSLDGNAVHVGLTRIPKSHAPGQDSQGSV